MLPKEIAIKLVAKYFNIEDFIKIFQSEIDEIKCAIEEGNIGTKIGYQELISMPKEKQFEHANKLYGSLMYELADLSVRINDTFEAMDVNPETYKYLVKIRSEH